MIFQSRSKLTRKSEIYKRCVNSVDQIGCGCDSSVKFKKRQVNFKIFPRYGIATTG